MVTASSSEWVYANLTEVQGTTLRSVKAHAEKLLDHTPRFKFFTLHGKPHLEYLFMILETLIQGGIRLSKDELYLLSLAICIHDLGMVTQLRNHDIKELLQGRNESPDPAALELFIRDVHHELVDAYLEQHVKELIGMGITPVEAAQVSLISKCHRKVILQQQQGNVRDLGALLRVVDELDVSSARAPVAILVEYANEMDSTSCWHWFKHNIVEDWMPDHNVRYVTEGSLKKIHFEIIVHPSQSGSIEYWLRQTRRPIFKALLDDGAQRIIQDRFNVQINIEMSSSRSSAIALGPTLSEIEQKAMSSGRKVVLVIDDESRKLEDLFLPLTDDFHVIYSSNANDAISKLNAAPVNLCIVDMQIGSGGLWGELETSNFKATGLNIIQHLEENYPNIKIGILTGTQHSLPESVKTRHSFFLRKPVPTHKLIEAVKHALS